MTKSTTKETLGVYSYAPGVSLKPRRVRVPSSKKWVGLGSSLKITPQPPKLPYTVPEANQTELAELYEQPGFKKLIIFTPSKNVPAVQEPVTGSVERPEEDK